MYEQAHYDTGFYNYSILFMLMIWGGCVPMVAYINGIMQSLVLFNQNNKIISILAYAINLFHLWPLLQFTLILTGIVFLEFAIGKSVVNFYAHKSYDLKSLLRYLQFVESSSTVHLNRTCNIS
jgi:hypothetical protein